MPVCHDPRWTIPQLNVQAQLVERYDPMPFWGAPKRRGGVPDKWLRLARPCSHKGLLPVGGFTIDESGICWRSKRRYRLRKHPKPVRAAPRVIPIGHVAFWGKIWKLEQAHPGGDTLQRLTDSGRVRPSGIVIVRDDYN